MRVMLIAAGILLRLGGGARAEVVDAQPNGFEVRQTIQIAAPTDKVYKALTQPGRWWSSAHTFSGDASHLSLEPRAGGCFCEALPDGGSAAHLRVIMTQPGQTLRLEGALGPLQTLGVTGHLTWALAAKAGGTELTQTYDVGGYAKGGFGGWAPPVDRVLGDRSRV